MIQVWRVPREWQPMSAAPKDGTLILVYDGSHMATARWCEPLKLWWSEDVCLDGQNIAAWMPLPHPPQTKSKEVA